MPWAWFGTFEPEQVIDGLGDEGFVSHECFCCYSVLIVTL